MRVMTKTLSVVAVAAVSSAASADTLFVGSLGSGHAGAATFGTLDDARNPAGNTTPDGIFVRIENTISNDFNSLESRVLTAVFFDIAGSVAVATDSATQKNVAVTSASRTHSSHHMPPSDSQSAKAQASPPVVATAGMKAAARRPQMPRSRGHAGAFGS